MGKKTLVIDALPLVIKEIESRVPGWYPEAVCPGQYCGVDEQLRLVYGIAAEVFSMQEDDYTLFDLPDNITFSDWLNEWYRLATDLEAGRI